MITRVSTSTEGYDPYRKGRRVVTIDKRHMELIGYTPQQEIVGGEAWDAFKEFLCKLTGWCGHAAQSVSDGAKDTVVKMLPEENGEEPGNTAPPGFEDADTGTMPGMPASSAPEDYGGPTSPSGYPATVPAPAAPPPLPAAAVPIMANVAARLKQGDPAALKSIQQLAGQSSTNPIAAQTLKNIALMSFKTPTGPAPAAVYRPGQTRTLAAGGSVGTAIGDIFKLVLSPLAWTLDGTGRLTAIAGQKLEHLSRLI